MRNRHGLKRYKCGYCNDRFDNRTSLGRHEKQKHENVLFHCEQCEYSSPRKDRLGQHIRSKHLEKNIKCDQCDFVTDRNYNMKKHVNAIHLVKVCNECNFKTKSIRSWSMRAPWSSGDHGKPVPIQWCLMMSPDRLTDRHTNSPDSGQ